MSSPKRSSATTSHNCAATTAPLTSPDQIASIPTPGRRRAIRRSDRHALMPCRYDAGTLARSIPRVTTRMTRVYDAANTAYLIEVEDEEEFESWLALNGETLFEAELDGWYSDPKLWPRDRSVALFKEWCTFELHTLVVDTGGTPLYDDDLEDEG